MIYRVQFLLACLAVSGLIAGCEDKSSEKNDSIVRPVKALKVSDTSVLQNRWFPGRAKAANEVELSFRVSGTLIELPVNVGDEVTKGDVFARIDPDIYQAEVDRISANLQKAQAELKNAALQLKRQVTLYEKGHVAEAVLDKYQAQESAKKADVAAQEAALKKAQLDLNYTVLRAPFSGTVVATYVDNYQDVLAKTRVARLVDSSQIEMIVNVPEKLITLAPQVKEAEVVFDAFPDTKVPARVKEIGEEASQTTRTYPITLIMDQPEGSRILPGMAGKATGKRVEFVGSDQTVIVPPSALFLAGENSSAVWVIDESSMTVSKKQVKVGPLRSKGIQVNTGLKRGDWIVTAGVHALKEGQKVRFLEQ